MAARKEGFGGKDGETFDALAGSETLASKPEKTTMPNNLPNPSNSGR